MSCETGGAPEEAQKPPREVDPYRANRELERWLRLDLDAPRADQKGSDSGSDSANNTRISPDWRDGAKIAGTFIYTRDEDGKIVVRYEEASDNESPSEK